MFAREASATALRSCIALTMAPGERLDAGWSEDELEAEVEGPTDPMLGDETSDELGGWRWMDASWASVRAGPAGPGDRWGWVGRALHPAKGHGQDEQMARVPVSVDRLSETWRAIRSAAGVRPGFVPGASHKWSLVPGQLDKPPPGKACYLVGLKTDPLERARY